MSRTFAIGDIHGDLDGLEAVLRRLPELHPTDTLVFVGDYVDRGPGSAQVIARVRKLQADGPARVIALRRLALASAAALETLPRRTN